MAGMILVLLPGMALAGDDALGRAREAYDSLRYERAQRILVQGIEAAADDNERVALFELLATVSLVLGQEEDAARALDELLSLRPDYRLSNDASPKIERLFARVRERRKQEGSPPEPAPPVRAVEVIPPATQPAPAEPPAAVRPPQVGETPGEAAWYSQWWVWTAVGALAVGTAAVALWSYNHPEAPAGHVGPIRMP